MLSSVRLVSTLVMERGTILTLKTQPTLSQVAVVVAARSHRVMFLVREINVTLNIKD